MTAREVLKRYESEINKHDFNLLAPMISKDCKFWFSSGSYEGLEQARHAFEKTWNLIREEVYSISSVEWMAESDCTAFCTYAFQWKGIIDGKPCEGKGRGTSCFRKEDDGWKLIHEHLSNFPK